MFTNLKFSSRIGAVYPSRRMSPLRSNLNVCTIIEVGYVTENSVNEFKLITLNLPVVEVGNFLLG
jgi:hypothetical protein